MRRLALWLALVCLSSCRSHQDGTIDEHCFCEGWITGSVDSCEAGLICHGMNDGRCVLACDSAADCPPGCACVDLGECREGAGCRCDPPRK